MLYESAYYGVCDLGDSLQHHGIKGQKWGIRRYQNPDGTLTPLGKKRYGTIENYEISRQIKKDRSRRILKGVAVGAGVGLAAYGLTKLAPNIKSKSVSSSLSNAEKASSSIQDVYKKAFGTNRGETLLKYRHQAKDRASETMAAKKKILWDQTVERVSKNSKDVDTLLKIRGEKTTKERWSHKDRDLLDDTIDDILKDSLEALRTYANFTKNSTSIDRGKQFAKSINLKDMTMDDLRKLDLY